MKIQIEHILGLLWGIILSMCGISYDEVVFYVILTSIIITVLVTKEISRKKYIAELTELKEFINSMKKDSDEKSSKNT